VTRHFLDVDDLSCDELDAVLALAGRAPETLRGTLEGRGAAVVLEKPSLRTRASTELAVWQLGGHAVVMQGSEVGVGERESPEDVARTLAGYCSVICARVARHDTLERMVAALESIAADVGVVNLLSDLAHPCQALADILTMQQVLGDLGGLTLCYVGDANNTFRSLAMAATMRGMKVRIAAPDGPDPDELDAVARLGGELEVTNVAFEAVTGADVVYTDVWTSMGQETEGEVRRKAFRGFSVDDDLLARAEGSAIVMHCLPAHRVEEISDSVIEGPRSRVWLQAANRLPAVRGLLGWMSGAGGAG